MCECVHAFVAVPHEEARSPCCVSSLSTLFSETESLTQAQGNHFGYGGRSVSSRDPAVSTSPAPEFRHVLLYLFIYMAIAYLNSDFHIKHSTTRLSSQALPGAFDKQQGVDAPWMFHVTPPG